MINKFRHGIISYPGLQVGSQSFLTKVGNDINLNVTPTESLDYTIAHGSANYMLTETATVPAAWTVSGPRNWIYIEIHPTSAKKTFGVSKAEPIYQHVRPTNPPNDTMWYDTARFKQFVYQSGYWKEVIRIVLAEVQGSEFISISSFSGTSFAGTQIGSDGLKEVDVGRIIFDEAGQPVKRNNGEFYTTVTPSIVTGNLKQSLRVESTILNKQLRSNIAAYTMVTFDNDGDVSVSKYSHIGTRSIGIALQSGVQGDVAPILMQGIVTNPDWDWMYVGDLLWYTNDGVITNQDPHVMDPVNYRNPRPAIGRVIGPREIYLTQSLITTTTGSSGGGDVKTVNSIGPDNNGNIELSLSDFADSDDLVMNVPANPTDVPWVRRTTGWTQLSEELDAGTF